MEITQNKKIEFIREHDGEIEREFKSAISFFLEKSNIKVRAYLIQVVFDDNQNEFNVALCFDKNTNQKILLDGSITIFKKFFGIHEHLDVIFLDQSMEVNARKVSCPFYISENNQFNTPDFYLTSSDSYDLSDFRSCFKRKKLIGSNNDGYMLCDISPNIPGEKFSLNQSNISQVVLVSRHKGYSLFPITSWPTYVHVARVLRNSIENGFVVNDSDIESIGWGEIYSDKNKIV